MEHEIVLSDINVKELREIIERKAPKYLPDLEVFLAELSFDLIPAVEYPNKIMRDPKRSTDS